MTWFAQSVNTNYSHEEKKKRGTLVHKAWLLMTTYLVANNLVEPLLPAHVDYSLELPASDVAHANVVDLAAADEVVQSPQCLLQWSAIVPAVDLWGRRGRDEGGERGMERGREKEGGR